MCSKIRCDGESENFGKIFGIYTCPATITQWSHPSLLVPVWFWFPEPFSHQSRSCPASATGILDLMWCVNNSRTTAVLVTFPFPARLFDWATYLVHCSYVLTIATNSVCVRLQQISIRSTYCLFVPFFFLYNLFPRRHRLVVIGSVV
jgi:hypothetical protein